MASLGKIFESVGAKAPAVPANLALKPSSYTLDDFNGWMDSAEKAFSDVNSLIKGSGKNNSRWMAPDPNRDNTIAALQKAYDSSNDAANFAIRNNKIFGERSDYLDSMASLRKWQEDAKNALDHFDYEKQYYSQFKDNADYVVKTGNSDGYSTAELDQMIAGRKQTNPGKIATIRNDIVGGFNDSTQKAISTAASVYNAYKNNEDLYADQDAILLSYNKQLSDVMRKTGWTAEEAEKNFDILLSVERDTEEEFRQLRNMREVRAGKDIYKTMNKTARELLDRYYYSPDEYNHKTLRELMDATGWTEEETKKNTAQLKYYFDAENAEKAAGESEKFAEEHPGIATLHTNIRQLWSGTFGALDFAGQELANAIAGNPDAVLNLNTKAQLPGIRNQTVRAKVASDIEEGKSTMALGFIPNPTNAQDKDSKLLVDYRNKNMPEWLGGGNVGSFIYNTGVSAIDSTVNRTVGMALGNFVNVDPTAFSSAFTNWVMGSNVARDTITENVKAGKSNWEALSKGTLYGMVEGITEAVGGEFVVNAFSRAAREASVSAAKAVFRAYMSAAVKSMAAEGIEEVFSNWMDAVVDRLYNGNKGALDVAFEKVLAENPTMSKDEAAKKALISVIGNDAGAFLSGALSTFGDAAAGMVRSYSSLNHTASELTKAGYSAKEAKMQAYLLQKILMTEDEITDADLDKLDLNNSAVRAVYAKATGLDGLLNAANLSRPGKRAYVEKGRGNLSELRFTHLMAEDTAQQLEEREKEKAEALEEKLESAKATTEEKAAPAAVESNTASEETAETPTEQSFKKYVESFLEQNKRDSITPAELADLAGGYAEWLAQNGSELSESAVEEMIARGTEELGDRVRSESEQGSNLTSEELVQKVRDRGVELQTPFDYLENYLSEKENPEAGDIETGINAYRQYAIQNGVAEDELLDILHSFLQELLDLTDDDKRGTIDSINNTEGGKNNERLDGSVLGGRDLRETDSGAVRGVSEGPRELREGDAGGRRGEYEAVSGGTGNRLVTPADIIPGYGTEEAYLEEVSESEIDRVEVYKEITGLAKVLGAKVQLLRGGTILLKGRSPVRGVWNSAKRLMSFMVDNRSATAKELYFHESFHVLVDLLGGPDSAGAKRFFGVILNRAKQNRPTLRDTKSAIDEYKKHYPYGTDEGKYLEEIIADAYAGINPYNVPFVSELSGALTGILGDRAGDAKAYQTAMMEKLAGVSEKQLRGGGLRYSADLDGLMSTLQTAREKSRDTIEDVLSSIEASRAGVTDNTETGFRALNREEVDLAKRNKERLIAANPEIVAAAEAAVSELDRIDNGETSKGKLNGVVTPSVNGMKTQNESKAMLTPEGKELSFTKSAREARIKRISEMGQPVTGTLRVGGRDVSLEALQISKVAPGTKQLTAEEIASDPIYANAWLKCAELGKELIVLVNDNGFFNKGGLRVLGMNNREYGVDIDSFAKDYAYHDPRLVGYQQDTGTAWHESTHAILDLTRDDRGVSSVVEGFLQKAKKLNKSARDDIAKALAVYLRRTEKDYVWNGYSMLSDPKYMAAEELIADSGAVSAIRGNKEEQPAVHNAIMSARQYLSEYMSGADGKNLASSLGLDTLRFSMDDFDPEDFLGAPPEHVVRQAEQRRAKNAEKAEAYKKTKPATKKAPSTLKTLLKRAGVETFEEIAKKEKAKAKRQAELYYDEYGDFDDFIDEFDIEGINEAAKEEAREAVAEAREYLLGSPMAANIFSAYEERNENYAVRQTGESLSFGRPLREAGGSDGGNREDARGRAREVQLDARRNYGLVNDVRELWRDRSFLRGEPAEDGYRDPYGKVIPWETIGVQAGDFGQLTAEEIISDAALLDAWTENANLGFYTVFINTNGDGYIYSKQPGPGTAGKCGGITIPNERTIVLVVDSRKNASIPVEYSSAHERFHAICALMADADGRSPLVLNFMKDWKRFGTEAQLSKILQAYQSAWGSAYSTFSSSYESYMVFEEFLSDMYAFRTTLLADAIGPKTAAFRNILGACTDYLTEQLQSEETRAAAQAIGASEFRFSADDIDPANMTDAEIDARAREYAAEKGRAEAARSTNAVTKLTVYLNALGLPTRDANGRSTYAGDEIFNFAADVRLYNKSAAEAAREIYKIVTEKAKKETKKANRDKRSKAKREKRDNDNKLAIKNAVSAGGFSDALTAKEAKLVNLSKGKQSVKDTRANADKIDAEAEKFWRENIREEGKKTSFFKAPGGQQIVSYLYALGANLSQTGDEGRLSAGLELARKLQSAVNRRVVTAREAAYGINQLLKESKSVTGTDAEAKKALKLAESAKTEVSKEEVGGGLSGITEKYSTWEDNGIAYLAFYDPSNVPAEDIASLIKAGYSYVSQDGIWYKAGEKADKAELAVLEAGKDETMTAEELIEEAANKTPAPITKPTEAPITKPTEAPITKPTEAPRKTLLFKLRPPAPVKTAASIARAETAQTAETAQNTETAQTAETAQNTETAQTAETVAVAEADTTKAAESGEEKPAPKRKKLPPKKKKAKNTAESSKTAEQKIAAAEVLPETAETAEEQEVVRENFDLENGEGAAEQILGTVEKLNRALDNSRATIEELKARVAAAEATAAADKVVKESVKQSERSRLNKLLHAARQEERGKAREIIRKVENEAEARQKELYETRLKAQKAAARERKAEAVKKAKEASKETIDGLKTKLKDQKANAKADVKAAIRWGEGLAESRERFAREEERRAAELKLSESRRKAREKIKKLKAARANDLSASNNWARGLLRAERANARKDINAARSETRKLVQAANTWDAKAAKRALYRRRHTAELDSTNNGSGAILNTNEVKKQRKTLADRARELRTMGRKLYSNLVSRTIGLEAFARRQTRTDDIGTLINIVTSCGSTVEMISTTGLVNKKGDIIGKAAKDVFICWKQEGNKTVQDEDAQNVLKQYLVYNRAVELMSIEQRARDAVEAFEAQYPFLTQLTQDEFARLITSGNPIASKYEKLINESLEAKNKTVLVDNDGKPISAETAQAAADKLAELQPWVVEKAEEIYSWWNDFFSEWGVGDQLTQEQYEHLHEMHPHYVPLHRVRDGVSGGGFGATKGGTASTGKLLHSLKGSALPIAEIEDQFYSEIARIVKMSRMEQMNRNILEEAIFDEAGEFKEFAVFDSVDSKSRAEEMFGEGFLDTERDASLLKSEGDGACKIIAHIDGVQATAYISREMYEGLQWISNAKGDTTGEQVYQTMLRLGNKLTGWQKTLITGINPAFAVRNVIRDFPTAVINSISGLAYPKYWVRAAKEIASNSKNWQVFQALGGCDSTYYNNENGYAKSLMARDTAGAKAVEALGTVNNVTEAQSRFAEYLATIDRLPGGDTYENRLRGIKNSAEVTVDFSRSGKFGKVINSWVPYWNPAVQGVDKLIRSVFLQPNIKAVAGTLGRAAVVSMLPEILMRALLYATGRKDDWDKLSDYTKDSYYCFPAWWDEHEFIRLPKNREWAAILGTGLARILDGIEGRADPFESYLQTSIEANFLPPEILSNMFGVGWALELAKNENFAGSRIIPYQYEDAKPSEQYDADTSLVAKFIADTGNLLGDWISPMQVDYILKDYVGDFYGMLLDAAPFGLTQGDLTGEDVLTTLKEDVKGSWISDNRYSNSITSEYYDMIKELTETVNTLKLRDENYTSSIEYQLQSALNSSYAQQMSALSKEARMMKPGEGRDAIREQMVIVASEAIDLYDKVLGGEVTDPKRYVKYLPFGEDVAEEMVRMAAYEADYSFEPLAPTSKYISSPNSSMLGYNLTEADRSKYKEMYQGWYERKLTDAIRTHDYKLLSGTEKAERLEKAQTEARTAATESLVEWLDGRGVEPEIVERYKGYDKNVLQEIIRLEPLDNSKLAFTPVVSPSKYTDPDNKQNEYVLNDEYKEMYYKFYEYAYSRLMAEAMADPRYATFTDAQKAAYLTDIKAKKVNPLVKEAIIRKMQEDGFASTPKDVKERY